jgi:hypothetical protein
MTEKSHRHIVIKAKQLIKLLEMSGFMKWRSRLMPQACSSLPGSSPWPFSSDIRFFV